MDGGTWSVSPLYRDLRTRGLGATLGDEQKIKNYFSSFRVFSGKADVILLGFQYTTIPQLLVKIVGAIFEKIKIFNLFYFSSELPLILGVSRKRKEHVEDIYKGTPDIEFEQDVSVGLGHGRAKVAHCVTGRWRNVSHYSGPLRLICVFCA